MTGIRDISSSEGGAALPYGYEQAPDSEGNRKLLYRVQNQRDPRLARTRITLMNRAGSVLSIVADAGVVDHE